MTAKFFPVLAFLVLGLARGRTETAEPDLYHRVLRVVTEANAFQPKVILDLKHDRHALVDQQRLDLLMNGLEANQPYRLMAEQAGVAGTVAVPFVASEGGVATFHFRRLPGGAATQFPGSLPLPPGLESVSRLRAVWIVRSNDTPVAHLDLGRPDRLQLLVRQGLRNQGVEPSALGVVRLHGTMTTARIHLAAQRLEPSARYRLSLNGSVMETNRADMAGRLVVLSALERPGEILNLRSVGLLNERGDPVLSAELP